MSKSMRISGKAELSKTLDSYPTENGQDQDKGRNQDRAIEISLKIGVGKESQTSNTGSIVTRPIEPGGSKGTQ
jgi:hypothetical protein